MFNDISRDDLYEAALEGMKHVDEWQGLENVSEADREHLVGIATAFYANLLTENDDKEALTTWFFGCMTAAYNLGRGIPVDQLLSDTYSDFINSLDLD